MHARVHAGRGIPQSEARALQLLRCAASRGYAPSTLHLAALLLERARSTGHRRGGSPRLRLGAAAAFALHGGEGAERS